MKIYAINLNENIRPLNWGCIFGWYCTFNDIHEWSLECSFVDECHTKCGSSHSNVQVLEDRQKKETDNSITTQITLIENVNLKLFFGKDENL